MNGSLASRGTAGGLVLIDGARGHGRFIAILATALGGGILGSGSEILARLPAILLLAILLLAVARLGHGIARLGLLAFEGRPGGLGLALGGDVLGDVGRFLQMLLERRQGLAGELLEFLIVSQRGDVLNGQDVLHMLAGLMEHVSRLELFALFVAEAIEHSLVMFG